MIMLYGISSTPEIFYKTINRIMERLDVVHVFIDDILIWGCTKEEHDGRLQGALKESRQLI